LLKNVGGLAAITPQLADMVSAEIWGIYPWRVSITNIAAGLIPLVDGQQDYSAPTNIYRLLKISITRTDTTPDDNRELNVVQDLSDNMVSQSYQSIRSAALQRGIGKIRLESAVQVPSGTLLELSGQYQMNPAKITALTDQLWFDDQHVHVFLKGLMYWAYKLGDDPRASVQLNEYRQAVEQMARAEDFGAIDTIFPGEGSIGSGSSGGWNIWGW